MTPIRQAVLLAAGRGTRLGALTTNFPKAMLEVGGQPIIHRIVAGLAAAGIADITVVTGHVAELLEDSTGNGERWGVNLRYVRQSEPTGTARALSLARDWLAETHFFVGWGDIVVEASNYAAVVETGASFGAALAVNHVADPTAGGAVYTTPDMFVSRLVEKPPPETSSTSWNNAGLAVLPPDIWPYLDALEPSPRGEYELPVAIAALIAAGHRVRAVPIGGPWFDVGTPENLEGARAYFGGA